MDKTNRLLDMLMELPPDPDKIEKHLNENEYSVKEITLAACKLAEECQFECGFFRENRGQNPAVSEIHSPYIYGIFELLLKYGLDPNLKFSDGISETNVMDELRYLDFEDTAADTMKLLLENGGNPFLVIDGTPLFETIDFDVIFDVVELKGEDFFHIEFKIWLVMIGYGATIKGGECPIKIQNGYTAEDFRDFKRFGYEIEFKDKDWTLHIIDNENQTKAAFI